jgi:hypothetical protein
MNHKGFILIAIENFLNAELNPAAIHETLAAKPQSYWENVFEVECTAAVRLLKELRYQIPAGESIRHQQLVYTDAFGIIGLLKRFEKTQSFAHSTYPPHSLYTAVIPYLETVVQYIEGTGNESMKPGTLVPDFYLEGQVEKIRTQHLVLQAKMKSKEIDPALQQLINHHFNQFVDHKPCRYQQLQYNRSLIDALLGLLSLSKSTNWTRRLINKLVMLNFNHPAFYEYCTESITVAVEQEQSLERKCACLHWHTKELKSLMINSAMALDPEAHSARKLILMYLAATLDFLEVKRPRHPAASLLSDQTPTGKIIKLTLNASSPQLCLCIQYLMQHNFFPAEKGGIKNILQFFADHFSTIGAETLSVQSLQKRISEKNDAAILGVLRVLEDMVIALKASLGS